MSINFFIDLPKGTILELYSAEDGNKFYYKHSFSVCKFGPKDNKKCVILYGCYSNNVKDIVINSLFGPIIKVSPCNNVVNISSYESGMDLIYTVMKVSKRPSNTFYCFKNKYLSDIVYKNLKIYADYNDQGFEEVDIENELDENCDPEEYYFVYPGDYGFISGEDYKYLNY